MKIPNELIPLAYKLSKKVYEGKLTFKEAQNQLAENGQMNYSSTADFLRNFRSLMEGKQFARTLNSYSMEYFIDHIYKDYGSTTLSNALKALQLHYLYYEGLQNGREMHKMREIHSKYSLNPDSTSEKQELNEIIPKPQKKDEVLIFEVANIESLVSKFRSQSNPDDRYTSFDYCFNYFQPTNDLNKDIEKSCLVLGFYLSSWGMFRGSSFLLQKSVKHFEPTIQYIATLDKSVWDIDVDTYNEETIHTIIEIYKGIKRNLIHDNNSDLTLITKILLGIFGFIPAFDTYFCNSFRAISGGHFGFSRVNEKSLNFINMFYESNKPTIDKLSSETYTTNFLTGQKTMINYPKAKIIDMYGFTAGQ